MTGGQQLKFNVTDTFGGGSNSIITGNETIISNVTGFLLNSIIANLTDDYATTLAYNETTSQSIIDDEVASCVWYTAKYPNFQNPNFECNRTMYMEYHRGPQQLPLITALAVTILFAGILVTGVIGNLIVCVVIVNHQSMHTATNYYLFSLAVSDLIFLMMGLPYEISLYWHQYPYNLGLAFCKIRAWISEASTYVSVLTIVAFSMERFLAICHPLHSYRMSGLRRAMRIMAVLWTMSFLSAVPFGLYTDIDYLVYPPDNSTIYESAFCAMLQNPGYLWELSTCIFFAIPMAVMVIMYGRMGLRIRSRTKQAVELGKVQGSIHGETKTSQSRKAIIRMLAAVVITFFVCWAPFHAQRLLYLYAQEWTNYNDVNTWLFSIAGWLYYVSCTINPILYNVMSHRYRVAFKETLCGKKRQFYNTNGFARDQSSFRETTVHSSYETGFGRSRHGTTRYTTRSQNRNHLTTGSIRFNDREEKNLIKSEPLLQEEDQHPTDIVVYLGSNTNGTQVCYVAPAVAVTPATGNHVMTDNTELLVENGVTNNNCKDETCI